MKSKYLIYSILFVLLICSALLSLCVGAVEISLPELVGIIGEQLSIPMGAAFTSQQKAVFLSIRLPRVLLGALVGGTLALAGASIQGLFRNPLAEPGLIGISSGAGLFAVLVIVLEAKFFGMLTAAFGYYALSAAAFAGACLAGFLVYRMAMKNGKADMASLLLAGIAINALAGSFTGLLTYLATDDQLRNITFWSMGSLGGANWKVVSSILPFVLVPMLSLPFFGKALNAMALGESQAAHMGVNTGSVKRAVIVLATMGVGASVAVSGLIGFIGLVVPHILRMSCTADNRLVVPASALLGASILVLADLLARSLVAPSELPIGILTAIIGSPVFIYIIISERRKRNNL